MEIQALGSCINPVLLEAEAFEMLGYSTQPHAAGTNPDLHHPGAAAGVQEGQHSAAEMTPPGTKFHL